MKRLLASLLFFCAANPVWSGISVQTCTAHEPALEFRDAIYSEDVDLAERTISEMQVRFEAGEAVALDVRCSLFFFSLMRPKSAEFAEAWLESYPSSPFAMVARAGALDRFSWAVRGNRLSARTCPTAIREFSAMQREAWALASAAYDANPRLLPASDLLLGMANAVGRRDVMRQIVIDVMARDANDWTIEMFQSQIMKNWGATWQDVLWICSNWAGRKPSADELSEDTCLVRGALAFPATFEWAYSRLETGGFPSLDWRRLQTLLRSNAPREDVERALELLEGASISSNLVPAYDNLAMKYGLPYMTETLSQRGYDNAIARLEHEPLNANILSLLVAGIEYTIPRADLGHVERHVRQVATPKERLDYTHRMVLASPYDPDRWSQLERAYNAVHRLDKAESEPFQVNQVVYSNHAPDALQRYISRKMFTYNAISKAQAGDPALLPDSVELLLRIDREKDVLCPFVRGYRLFRAQCYQSSDGGCRVDPHKAEVFEVLADKAASGGLCFKERQAPIEALFFDPHPVPPLPVD